ncbi:MAG: hypothetical protein CMP11_03705 [Zetaproteobacteria bacterium]|nr:hypothetical protein [Pseudobdellovibrionaceae bacterium]
MVIFIFSFYLISTQKKKIPSPHKDKKEKIFFTPIKSLQAVYDSVFFIFLRFFCNCWQKVCFFL